MTPPVYILVTPMTAASGIAGPMDIFHTTNLLLKNIVGADAEPLRWHTVGLERTPVTTAGGLTVQPERTLDELVEPGWLFIPGVVVDGEQAMQALLADSQPLVDALARLYRAGHSIAANCTGVFLLAETGLLDGKVATTTWWLENLFHKRYPCIDLAIDSLITEDERLMCSGTAMAYMELALNLVDKLAGGKYAHLCRKYLLMGGSHDSQAAYRRLSGAQPDPFIQNANRYLLRHLHEDLRMDDLADALAVSNRTLIRRFKQATGDTPVQRLQKMRIERSKYLLETSSLSLDEILQRIGYQDGSTFGRMFKRYTGLTPGQYRHRFAQAQA